MKKIREDLIRHEALKLFPYKCTAGKLTIGVGRNLDDKKLKFQEITYLLGNNERRKEKFKNVPKELVFAKLIEDFKEFGISEEEAFMLLDNDIKDCE